MRLVKLIHPCLFLLICGVCHPFSSEDEEEEYSDEGKYRRLGGELSLPYGYIRRSLSQLSDISGDYQSDQPSFNPPITDQSNDFNRSISIDQPKTSSSRTKAGRKKGRKSSQSTTKQHSSTRRKTFKAHQKATFKIKSQDLYFQPDFYGQKAQRSCPMRYSLLTLERATNINNELVDVYQPGQQHVIEGLENFSQTFYTETCLNNVGHRDCPGCCKGIDHSIYSSSCVQRLSYVQALVSQPGSSEFFWSHIKVNSSCVCKFALDLP